MYRNIDFYLKMHTNVWFTVVMDLDVALLTVWQMDRIAQQIGKAGKILVQYRKATVEECLIELNRAVALGDLY